MKVVVLLLLVEECRAVVEVREEGFWGVGEIGEINCLASPSQGPTRKVRQDEIVLKFIVEEFELLWW